jgi:hypothetical protein
MKKLSVLVFWVVMPSGLIGRYQRFGGTCCLHLQGLTVHTTQKTNSEVFTAVRTTDIICKNLLEISI